MRASGNSRTVWSRISDTLREQGRGFVFAGRQVHFDVDGDHYYLDLLLFRVEQLRYVVIELETTKFDPRDAGQLGFYVALVEDRLRIHDMHQPTVGMLLVAEKNDTVVRYALAGTRRPVAVSRYDLTASAQAALPAEEALTRVALEVTADTVDVVAKGGKGGPGAPYRVVGNRPS